MRIEAVSPLVVNARQRNWIFVKVVTDQPGLVGWGEAFGFTLGPTTRDAVDRLIAPLCLGQDARDIEGLTRRLQRRLHNFGRNGAVTFGLSGLDIALWDIAGKAAGLPLWRLLGGSPREGIAAYASKLRLSEPRLVADACAKAAVRGFTGIKLHEITIGAVAAAREAIGPDVALMVDVNCPWSLLEATAIGRRLQSYDLAWLEEPIWPPEDLRSLTLLHRATGLPLAAGENIANAHAFKALAELEGVDVLQPSVTKVGGVSEFVAVGHLARLHGKQLAPHSPYLGPGYLATLQMAAVFPEMDWLEHFSVEPERRIFGDAVWPDARGRVAIPQGPGLGADPDPEVLSGYRV